MNVNFSQYITDMLMRLNHQEIVWLSYAISLIVLATLTIVLMTTKRKLTKQIGQAQDNEEPNSVERP